VDKRRWTEEIAEEAENAAKQQHMKTLYTLTKVLSNERPRQSAAVMDKNGKILNDKESKTKRWLEHFSEVLNRENPSNPVSEMEIELPDEIEEIDTSEPSRGEVRKAIGHLKNGKAPGIDNIQAELLKADVDYATTKVKEIIDIVWRDEKTPRKWRKGPIVKLPKKGNLKECKNWRGITLLSSVIWTACLDISIARVFRSFARSNAFSFSSSAFSFNTSAFSFNSSAFSVMFFFSSFTSLLQLWYIGTIVFL